MVRRRGDPNASMPFRPSPGSFKCSSMQWLLLQQMHYRGAEGRLSLARYRAFLKHAKKFSSHDQQSSRHGVWPTCGPNCAAYIARNFPGNVRSIDEPCFFQWRADCDGRGARRSSSRTHRQLGGTAAAAHDLSVAQLGERRWRISCGTVSPAPTRRSIEAARVNLASATAAKPASTESSVFCAECCRLIEHASA
jgi:hypothetical protein